MATLQEIRAKLLSQQQKNDNSSRDNSSYPFWNIPDGTSALFRFLPDGNPNNTYFWAERQIIKLPFSGMDNDAQKQVTVQVPCMEMFGKTCPILTEIRPWFKEPDLEATARTYWKKRSYIFQGFVVDDPINEKEKPENPIRRFIINPSIYGIISASLLDPEIEDLPIDYISGRDFRLAKTRKGQYADYSTSKWSMKTRSLNDDEIAAIEKFGLFDLNQYMPKEPTDEEVKIIGEMFQASVDGEPYDSARFSRYFKPNTYGNNDDDVDAKSSSKASAAKPIVSKPVAKVVEPVEPEEVEEEAVVSAKPSASEALAKLKARTAAPKAETASDDASPAKKVDPSAILEALRNRAKK